MPTHRPFRESRRDPTDRRSLRRTPIFVGDVVGLVDDLYVTMFVTGVLPRGHVEVVTTRRLQEALVRPDDLDDVQQALADGRVVPRAMPRDEIVPLTEDLAARVLPSADDDADDATVDTDDATADADEVPA